MTIARDSELGQATSRALRRRVPILLLRDVPAFLDRAPLAGLNRLAAPTAVGARR